MKIIVYSIAALLFFGTTLFARIGETENQIEARYGKPSPSALDGAKVRAKAYSYQGFHITVMFENGTSAVEIYEKGYL